MCCWSGIAWGNGGMSMFYWSVLSLHYISCWRSQHNTGRVVEGEGGGGGRGEMMRTPSAVARLQINGI